ncbi:MAG: hypothetical protein CMF52_06490 [Legionellales bacterium]|nr:hypothetical protein [Legionellales bacterium]
MSTHNFRGGQSENLRTEYSERQKYLQYINSQDIDFLNTLYDKKLYGFVNNNYEPIVPVPNTVLFGQYAGLATGLNFTVSMFNNFRAAFQEGSNLEAPTLISDLLPSKSFTNFDDSYNSFTRGVGLELSGFMVSEGLNQSLSFPVFVNLLNEIFFRQNFFATPLSKSGYALSNFSTVYNTGLYVDLGKNFSPNLDQLKVDLVIDPNFYCFAETAQKFGFKVDLNCPWRIAVDLNSPIAQDNILNNRPLSDFAGFYSDVLTLKIGYDDLWAIKRFYELLYIQYHASIGLPSISVDFSSVEMRKWLECLLIHRFRELGLFPREYKKTDYFVEIESKVLDIYNGYGLNSNYGAISYVNKFCSDVIRTITRRV